MKIKKVKKVIIKNKLIKAAYIKEVDSGKRQIVEIVEGRGLSKKITKEERPIIDRVNMPPVYDEREIIFDVWTIETKANGVKEIHEFANPEDAMRYKEGFR